MDRSGWSRLSVAFVLVALIALTCLLPGCSAFSNQATCKLSFKNFTTRQLLTLRFHIDAKTTGKQIKNAQLDVIEERTSKLRGLPLKKPVVFISMDATCLRYVLIDSMNQDTPPSETEADQKLLVALGLIPPTMNLEEEITNLLTEQIAGSYDTKEKIITIIQGEKQTALDQVTMSHEITHALQDQNFDLEKPPLKMKKYDGDNDLAIESLIEGDATQTMIAYGQQYLTPAQLLQAQSASSDTSMTQFNSAPLYIQQGLLFPYDNGMKFVDDLKSNGGEGSVDKAFGNPPLSSEQIIHPDQYTAGKFPVKVDVPDFSKTLGSGYRRINKDALGEFDLDSWFQQFKVTSGKKAAEGWAGNNIQYYQGPQNDKVSKGSLGLGNYMVMSLFQWKTDGGASSFMDSYKSLLESRYKGKSTKTLTANDALLFQGEDQFYYAGQSRNRMLLLQSNTTASIVKALTQFPGYPPTPSK
jgi:hypothetical protein